MTLFFIPLVDVCPRYCIVAGTKTRRHLGQLPGLDTIQQVAAIKTRSQSQWYYNRQSMESVPLSWQEASISHFVSRYR